MPKVFRCTGLYTRFGFLRTAPPKGLLLGLALLCAVASASAATVRGLVERQGKTSRDPATYLKVTLSSAASKTQRYTVYTDGKGMYYFQDVPPGTYNLEIWTPSANRRAAAYQVRVNSSNQVQQSSNVDVAPVLMFDPVLLERAWGMFDRTLSVRQSSFNELTKHWLGDPNTIPALIVVAKENLNNLDGVTNVLSIIRSVSLRPFLANRKGVEEFLATVSRQPRAKMAPNLQKQIKLIRARYQQQQPIKPAARR